MKCALLAALASLAFTVPAQAQSSAEARTARTLESLRGNTAQLEAFLQEMPKGGDLHNHLIGAIYAESFISWAAEDGLCVDPATFGFVDPPCADGTRPLARQALGDALLWRHLVEAQSMRHFSPGVERSGHEHFFSTFRRFRPAALRRFGDMLAEVARRAATHHELYVELIHDMDQGAAEEAAAKLDWSDDFAALEAQLRPGVAAVVESRRALLDQAEARMRELLRCGTPQAEPGCAVTVRYLSEVLRARPREQVFAEAYYGFALAQADPRIVGVNPVQPEDDPQAVAGFPLLMRIFEHLGRSFPEVPVSIHAGELTPALVHPDTVRFHVRESVERGRARRIGHGVSILHEDGWEALLARMARDKVLVEVCLTSNDLILGVRGSAHPLRALLAAGVPVALATDDEGVSRSDITREWLKGVLEQKLTYAELKALARASLEHSFAPGQSLHAGQACLGEPAGADKPSARCAAFLAGSEKARLQWRLEGDYAAFERRSSRSSAPQ